ncbi:hypothetical protein FJTKL_07889 [Diaporthe vaccinii]|uniref:Secreted protein n=1 Tax=Diaporthe vaccinii TaxID=105482 RepID=A0ABR4FDS3_9PEZI
MKRLPSNGAFPMGFVLSRWLLTVSASDDKDEQALVMVPGEAQLISTDHPQSNDGRPLESVLRICLS